LNRRVIIGIHGLGNKPKRRLLEDWWMASIAEGLARHGGGRKLRVRFELVYWADLMHPKPLEGAEISEPYMPAEGDGPLPRSAVNMRRVVTIRVREGLMNALGLASKVALGKNWIDEALKARMPDLHLYRTDEELRQAVQSRLIRRLRSARRWRRKVMLIAHSMGSLVAHDVLSEADCTVEDLEIEHFVTVGSPLGLEELKTVVQGPLRVPECVARWTNFSDPKDPVSSWDASIANDYKPNSRGVTVADRLVVNGYKNPEGRLNPHKIYGYLRTPEVSEAIAGFVR